MCPMNTLAHTQTWHAQARVHASQSRNQQNSLPMGKGKCNEPPNDGAAHQPEPSGGVCTPHSSQPGWLATAPEESIATTDSAASPGWRRVAIACTNNNNRTLEFQTERGALWRDRARGCMLTLKLQGHGTYSLHGHLPQLQATKQVLGEACR